MWITWSFTWYIIFTIIDDCTSSINLPVQSLSDPNKFIVDLSSNTNKCIYTKEQRELYKKYLL